MLRCVSVGWAGRSVSSTRRSLYDHTVCAMPWSVSGSVLSYSRRSSSLCRVSNLAWVRTTREYRKGAPRSGVALAAVLRRATTSLPADFTGCSRARPLGLGRGQKPGGVELYEVSRNRPPRQRTPWSPSLIRVPTLVYFYGILLCEISVTPGSSKWEFMASGLY